MTLLLNTFVCDYCEGVIAVDAPYRGFVVWRNGHDPLENAYIFPTARDAQIWSNSTNRAPADIREVRMTQEPRWRKSNGTVKGITLADTLYEIYSDHRFKPKENRAFLV